MGSKNRTKHQRRNKTKKWSRKIQQEWAEENKTNLYRL